MDTPLQVARPPARPLVIWDGDCGFCAFSVGVLRQRVEAGGLETVAYQELGERFPEIPRGNFAKAVHLVEPDGTTSHSARAVFRALDHQEGGCLFWRRYRKCGIFRTLSEWGYRRVARNREVAAWVARRLTGRERYERLKALARAAQD